MQKQKAVEFNHKDTPKERGAGGDEAACPGEGLPAGAVEGAGRRAEGGYEAAGTTAAKVSGWSSQPSTYWLTRTKTFMPWEGAP